MTLTWIQYDDQTLKNIKVGDCTWYTCSWKGNCN